MEALTSTGHSVMSSRRSRNHLAWYDEINRNFAVHWSSSFGGCSEEHGGTSDAQYLLAAPKCQAFDYFFGRLPTAMRSWDDMQRLQKTESLAFFSNLKSDDLKEPAWSRHVVTIAEVHFASPARHIHTHPVFSIVCRRRCIA